MGSTVNFVEFKQCPIPTTSYAELSKDMNLINLKKLWIRYVFKTCMGRSDAWSDKN